MVDELIRQAIAESRVVAFRHRGQRRIGEPQLYGKANGEPQLLLYQTGGSSFTSGPYPVWRRCSLSEITRFVVTSRTFPGARLDPKGEHPDWDEVWAIVGG